MSVTVKKKTKQLFERIIPMQYKSTRNGKISISSAQAIKQGLSVEGGLFVPEAIPMVSADEIASLAGMNYRERAYLILSKFLTDFTKEELENCISNAYTKAKFETDNIAPVYKLCDKATEHKITVEGTGWNKEIGIYNLGELVNYEFQSYKEEEKVLIEFIDKVIELFKEQNINLSYNSIEI